MKSFSQGALESLKCYVYRLIDPRNGETFYVGRGKGNRLFSHIRDELGNETDDVGNEADEVSNKLKRIREIRIAGFDVAHVVHRHGMELNVAKEVEAALIDAYPGLTNAVSGEDSGDRGSMHAEEIDRKYEARVASFKHKAILISINRSSVDLSLYEATRFAWKLSVKRIEKAELVLAVIRGVIKGVYVPGKWLEATSTNFPLRPDRPGRTGFEGHEACPEIKQIYMNHRLPDDARFGTGNPIRYTWKCR